MELEHSQGGRSMMSLKVSIFFRSSIISIKFCLHTLELSIIVSTASFVVLDTSKLVACRNKHFFFSNDNLCIQYLSMYSYVTLTNLVSHCQNFLCFHEIYWLLQEKLIQSIVQWLQELFQVIKYFKDLWFCKTKWFLICLINFSVSQENLSIF